MYCLTCEKALTASTILSAVPQLLHRLVPDSMAGESGGLAQVSAVADSARVRQAHVWTLVKLYLIRW